MAVDKERKLDAEFFVGIEGGIINRHSKWFSFGAMCVMDRNRREGFGCSPHFELPEGIITELLNGSELGEVTDKITGQKNSKLGSGTIGFLTRGIMDRANLYVPGIITALVPHLNEKLYFR